MTSLRGARNRVAEYVGERGGEQVLTREGYYIPQPFCSTGPGQAGPGSYSVDGMAVSSSGGHIVIPEFKGGSSAVSTKPVQTFHEGYAFQATPPYVRDRMLRDQRVVQFFCDNPALWESVKGSGTRLSLEVITSPSPGSVVRSHQMDFSLTPEVIQDMEVRMARL
ncbi:hypothetical protein [Actinomyces wuliandei]|uniref:hypothetical protein n=1 Tax=Actinomyces wuliandei TaxID=2057743 RepID=UPI000FD9F8E8|nr:hypothetical protein [Actinomyces wuliandei]